MKFAGAVFALAMIGTTGAYAGPIISDNFDSDTPQLNWEGDSVFSPVPLSPAQGGPSVDLVGASNGFQFLCGGAASNNCIDLDGSTGSGNDPAGEIASAVTLTAGHYHLSFTLGGNARGAADQTTVITLGDYTTMITLASGDAQTTYDLDIVSGVSGKLEFKDLGPSDQQGNILDNITLTSAVPEPMTWGMLLIGFFGLGAMIRSTRRANALTA
jgi:hypothetical protein